MNAKVNAEQIVEWLAAGHSAAKIAELAGVHLRTAYKLIAQHKPPPPTVELPADFDRAAALNTAIDRAVYALGTDGPAAAERLLALARSAKMLGLRAPKPPPNTYGGKPVKDALTELIERATREERERPRRPASPPQDAPGPLDPPQSVPPQNAPPPPDTIPLGGAPPPPPPPDENPWITPLKVQRRSSQPAGNNPAYHAPLTPKPLIR